MPALRKVVIFGVGLIGGSFALALRKAGAVGEVVGFGRSATTLESAKRLGILDRIGSHAAAEVGDADLVLLATRWHRWRMFLRASRRIWGRRR